MLASLPHRRSQHASTTLDMHNTHSDTCVGLFFAPSLPSPIFNSTSHRQHTHARFLAIDLYALHDARWAAARWTAYAILSTSSHSHQAVRAGLLRVELLASSRIKPPHVKPELFIWPLPSSRFLLTSPSLRVLDFHDACSHYSSGS